MAKKPLRLYWVDFLYPKGEGVIRVCVKARHSLEAKDLAKGHLGERVEFMELKGVKGVENGPLVLGKHYDF